MTDDIDLGADLEKLAHQMLKDAVQEGVKLSERLEVFKILSNHHVNVEKVNSKRAPPAGGGMTMGALRDRVDNQEAVTTGETDESPGSSEES